MGGNKSTTRLVSGKSLKSCSSWGLGMVRSSLLGVIAYPQQQQRRDCILPGSLTQLYKSWASNLCEAGAGCTLLHVVHLLSLLSTDKIKQQKLLVKHWKSPVNPVISLFIILINTLKAQNKPKWKSLMRLYLWACVFKPFLMVCVGLHHVGSWQQLQPRSPEREAAG